jgi:uncharacterized protein YlxP (DUF503 family)
VAIVGLLSLELHFPSARSLKDKRTVLRSVKDRLRKLNVSIAEVDHQDLWQRARLGVVAVGQSQAGVEQSLDAVVEVIERRDPGLIVGTTLDWLA